MKKILKVLGYLLAGILTLAILVSTVFYIKKSGASNSNFKKLGESAQTLTIDGVTFRDLNKNGKLDTYEDPSAGIDARVEDLLSQMTLEEKAGSMFITILPMTADGNIVDKPEFGSGPMTLGMSLFMPQASELIINKRMTSFNTIHAYDANIMATFNNNVQRIAERMRLGIPVTVASDPRHSAGNNIGAAVGTPAFSSWPSSLGLGATRDTSLVKEFGEIARQEYLATGIRLALHPMADLATEPRWARLNGTFGEDAELAAQMTKAYVLGFQGDSLSDQSVACMTKHFSGGGPQKDGWDAHFASGKEQAYPGDNFDYHLIPFVKGAFPANTAQIMPYYGIPMDQTDENVGFSYNKSIITKLLRDSLKYDGVICTDWGLVQDMGIKPAAPWGVEHLTEIERVEKILNAGCDMFGGDIVPEMVVELVNTGKISEARIDESVKRIMRDKFRLGLFDNPYVDEQLAEKICRNEDFVERGKEAQAKSVVLLKNDGILPLKKGVKIFLSENNDESAWGSFATVVDDPQEADVIVKRLITPYDEPKPGAPMLEQFFHQGRLFYNDEELKGALGDLGDTPTIFVVNIERAAILSPLNERANALIAEFGLEDDVLADLLFGDREPMGKLPVELPSSWEAVQKQYEDVPYDSEDPLYEYGHGLTY